MNNHTTERTAYSLHEFAKLFGKHRSWAYRLVSSGKIRTIIGFGSQMVPHDEVERILKGGN